MHILMNSDGRYLLAYYHPTKKRFRSEFTRNGLPNEADSIDDLKHARTYGSLESIGRAIRKDKQGKLGKKKR